ncbi:MAG: RNase P subunit p30 family protein [Nanoarchaeota archaeon]|nr:RNase P subunit p30 family protein [Nanoarchaeota archaeon]
MDIILQPLKKEKGILIFQKVKSKNELKEDFDGYLIDSDEKEIRKIIEFLKGHNEKSQTQVNGDFSSLKLGTTQRITSSLSKKKIAILGKDDDFNRRIIETCKIDYLVSPERGHFRDGVKQRDSGLNHVVAKEAREKNISIVINFSDILKLEGKEKSLLLAKIMQNIKVCRKAECKIKIASFAENESQLRSENELKAFLFSLGMSSEQVRDAVDFS